MVSALCGGCVGSGDGEDGEFLEESVSTFWVHSLRRPWRATADRRWVTRDNPRVVGAAKKRVQKWTPRPDTTVLDLAVAGRFGPVASTQAGSLDRQTPAHLVPGQ